MKVLELTVNGETVSACLKTGNVSIMITNKGDNIIADPYTSIIFDGMDDKCTYYRWLKKKLKQGDKIRIRIADAKDAVLSEPECVRNASDAIAMEPDYDMLLEHYMELKRVLEKEHLTAVSE